MLFIILIQLFLIGVVLQILSPTIYWLIVLALCVASLAMMWWEGFTGFYNFMYNYKAEEKNDKAR